MKKTTSLLLLLFTFLFLLTACGKRADVNTQAAETQTPIDNEIEELSDINQESVDSDLDGLEEDLDAIQDL